jgi:hypothetical protein
MIPFNEEGWACVDKDLRASMLFDKLVESLLHVGDEVELDNFLCNGTFAGVHSGEVIEEGSSGLSGYSVSYRTINKERVEGATRT